MDAAGDFVVCYTRNTDNNNLDVFAKLYNVDEKLVDVVPVATSPSPPVPRLDIVPRPIVRANYC